MSHFGSRHSAENVKVGMSFLVTLRSRRPVTSTTFGISRFPAPFLIVYPIAVRIAP